MKKQYGDYVGFPMEMTDAEILKEIPNALSGLFEQLKDFTDNMDLSTLQIIFSHYINGISPLGIDNQYRAIIAVKFKTELEE